MSAKSFGISIHHNHSNTDNGFKNALLFVLDTAMIFSVALFGSPIGLSSTVAAALFGSDQM